MVYPISKSLLGRRRRSDERAGRIPDEMVDRLCVVGSVETCIGKLRDLQNIGVERFCAYLVGSIEDIQGQLRIFGDSIIPVFSKMQSTGAKSRNQTEGTTNVR